MKTDTSAPIKAQALPFQTLAHTHVQAQTWNCMYIEMQSVYATVRKRRGENRKLKDPDNNRQDKG